MWGVIDLPPLLLSRDITESSWDEVSEQATKERLQVTCRSRGAEKGADEGGMIAYVDSSVVVRIVMQQPNTLAGGWTRSMLRVTSWLTQAECLRTCGQGTAAGRAGGRATTCWSAPRIVEHMLLRRMRRVAVSRVDP